MGVIAYILKLRPDCRIAPAQITPARLHPHDLLYYNTVAIVWLSARCRLSPVYVYTMGIHREAVLAKAPKMAMHIAFAMISCVLVCCILYFVNKELKQGAYGMSMCSSIVFWILPKIMCDIARHISDAHQISKSFYDEHIVVLEGSHAFLAVAKLLEQINAGECINGVAITRFGSFITYNLFATAFKVIFLAPRRGSMADGILVQEAVAWWCSDTKHITLTFTKEGDWVKEADGKFVKKLSSMMISSTSRTLNLKFLEYCGSVYYGLIHEERLPRTRPRTLPYEMEAR